MGKTKHSFTLEAASSPNSNTKDVSPTQGRDNPAYAEDNLNGVRYRPPPKSDDHKLEKQYDDTGDQNKNNDDAVMLERKVGLISGVGLIVGTMIGSGIFVSPQGIVRHTGSVGLSLIVWAASGFLSLLGALCYTEMGAMIPTSGGEYTYLLQTFAPIPESQSADGKKVDLKDNRGYGKTLAGFWRPLPAFTVCWVYTFIGGPTSLAIICLTFAQYFERIFSIGCYDYTPDPLPTKLIAACALLLITFINVYSVEAATRVQNVFTFAKLLSMAIITVGGVVGLAKGRTETLAEGFSGSTTSAGQIALAFYSGFWAFSGWNGLNSVAGEVKNPNVTLLRAILISLPLVTACYILVNVSYLTAMTKEEMIASDTVAVLFGGRLLGLPGEVIMIVSVAMSTFGAANGSAFGWGRVIYAAAVEKHTPEMLSYVHVRRKTPAIGIIFTSLLALLLIPFRIGRLIEFFGFTSWIYQGGVMLALLVLRKTRPDWERPVKVPLILPITMLLVSIFLVLAPIIDNPEVEYAYVLLFIASGLIFYTPFVFLQLDLPIMGRLTWLIQVLCESVPPEDVQDP